MSDGAIARARAWRLLRWGAMAAVLAVLALAAWRLDWSETLGAMRGASPALLLAAAAVNLLSLATRAVRWWIFLRRAGAPSLATALRGAVVGSGLNNVLPASGGEAARVLLVARQAGISTAAVLAALALDRLVELLSSVAIIVAAPLVVPLPAAVGRWRFHAAMALAFLLTLCALLALRAMRTARTARSARSARSATTTPHDLLRGGLDGRLGGGPLRLYGARFMAAISGLPTPRRLAAAVALSIVSWIGQAAAYHLTVRAVGFPASPLASLAAMLAVNVTFVFQATPGNVGVFQFVYALVMAAFGLSHHAAVGVAVLIQAVQILPVTALALLLAPHLVVGRLRRRADAAEGGRTNATERRTHP